MCKKHLKHVSSQLGSEIIALLYKTGNAAIRNVFSKHQKVNSEVRGCNNYSINVQ